MDSTIMSAILALVGSVAGTFGGIMAGNKLTEYRLKELEKKVDKHNNLIERMYKVEQKQAVTDEEIKVANHRISDLEERSK